MAALARFVPSFIQDQDRHVLILLEHFVHTFLFSMPLHIVELLVEAALLAWLVQTWLISTDKIGWWLECLWCGVLLILESLLAIANLAFENLERVDNFWTLLLLRLQFIDFLHKFENLLFALFKHLFELADLQASLRRALFFFLRLRLYLQYLVSSRFGFSLCFRLGFF